SSSPFAAWSCSSPSPPGGSSSRLILNVPTPSGALSPRTTLLLGSMSFASITVCAIRPSFGWSPRVYDRAQRCSRSPTERRQMESRGARVLGPGDGRTGLLGSMGARFMLSGDETEGGFSLVEHPIRPRALAAPLHRHSREDEHSFVLEGRLGALLGDEVVYGEPGDLIFKPRGQWHTFWNAGDEPARILELISPAGFERYFEQ